MCIDANRIDLVVALLHICIFARRCALPIQLIAVPFLTVLAAASIVALVFYLGNLRENLARRSREEKQAAIRNASLEAQGKLPPFVRFETSYRLL